MAPLLQTLRRAVEPHPTLRKVLLGSGVVAATWWVAMDVVGSLRFPGYSYVDYTISELSAQGAPTRLFMMLFSGIPYAVLMTAFGIGVWATAGQSRAQRITGALLVAEVLWGFVGGLLFPMAPRGIEGTLRNDMHAFYGIGMPILFVLAMIFGSRIFGKRFRYFTYGAIVALLVFGALTSLQAGKIPTGESTPYLGLVERANAYTSMLWIAVLALGLLRAESIGVRQEVKPAVTAQTTQSDRAKSPA